VDTRAYTCVHTVCCVCVCVRAKKILSLLFHPRATCPPLFSREGKRERERENSRNAGVNQSSVFLLDLSAAGKEKVRFIDVSL